MLLKQHFAGSKIKSQSSSSIKNYEVSKRVTAIRNPTGTIKRIVAAILIRDKLVVNELGENVLQKLSDEENNIEALVRDAMGFKQERGDFITISSGEFIDDIKLSLKYLGMKNSCTRVVGKIIYYSCFSYCYLWCS